MVVDVRIDGVESLARLSRALRGLGEAGLRRELNSGIVAATKPTRKKMRAAVAPALPKRGGLAADVLGSTRFTANTSLYGRNPGVRIKARGRRSIRRMNAAGIVRHRVFGRDVWVDQSVPGLQGFLDRPFEESRPEVVRAVQLAIGRVRSQIYRSV